MVWLSLLLLLRHHVDHINYSAYMYLGQHLCLPLPSYSCCLSPNPAILTLGPRHVDKVAASEELFSHTILTLGEVFWGFGVSKKGSRTPLPGQMSLGTRKEAESGHMAGTTINPMASH